MENSNVDGLAQRAAQLALEDETLGEPLFADYRTEAPPTPKLTSPGIVATDITAAFTQAASTLDQGELVKDDFFSLFESVGAIELMDPKMDTGFLQPGEIFKDEYDVSRGLLPEECLGIMDQIFGLEMAWHMGHPLSQTLFTSMHIDHILGLAPHEQGKFSFEPNVEREDRKVISTVLMAYCLAVIKTCSHVNRRVMSEHFYEDEDFSTYTFNRNLLDEIDDLIILDFVESTMEDLMATETIEIRVRKALAARLGFRSMFLSTVATVEDRSIPFELKRTWTASLESLPGIKSELAIASQVPEAFSAKLQRKLASTTPPRPVVTVAFDDGYKHLERLCNDGLVVTEVLNFHDSHSLMNFVLHFQKRKPQPSVYIRTLLQHYLFGGMIMLGMLSIRSILDSDLASISLPASTLLDPINDEVEVPTDPRHKMSCLMESFRQRAAEDYLNILRALCQNRCRIRRTLTHTITDWDNLQLESEGIDVELQQYAGEEPIVFRSFGPEPIHAFPLSSWCYHYKLRQMEWLVQMGFELDIYAPDEMAGMYWMLQSLSMTHYNHLQRIRAFLNSDLEALGRTPKVENPALKQGEFVNALAYINIISFNISATHHLAQAISCLYAVLERYNLIPLTPHPYSTDEIRYEQRMKHFLDISLPRLPPFQEFREGVTQPAESSLALLIRAEYAVLAAKSEFEMGVKMDAPIAKCEGKWLDEAWHRNAKEEVKSCIAASIAVLTVKKAVESAEKMGSNELMLKVECLPAETSYHDWWVIPKVMAIKEVQKAASKRA